MEMEMQEELQIVPMMVKDVEAQFVEIMVPLYSYGCGKKIKKALAHFKGIYSVNVDYDQQKVTVWGICNKKDVLSTIRAKRKGARFWKQQQDGINGAGLQIQSHTAPPSPPSIIKRYIFLHKLESRMEEGHLQYSPCQGSWRASRSAITGHHKTMKYSPR